MDFDQYINRAPWGVTGSPERQAHAREAGRLNALFRADAIREAGLEGHPLSEVLFDFAYEHGHSSGHSDVFLLLEDLASRIREVPPLGPPPIQVSHYVKDGVDRFGFRDMRSKLCTLNTSPIEEAVLYFGIGEHRMTLSREMAAGVVPLLQHFVITGALPD